MPESAKKSLVISVYFALALSTLAVFWQVRHFDFTDFDDNGYVYENSYVTAGLRAGSVIWAFTTGYQANWHPLTWLSLMFDCQLFGVNPGMIHIVNVLLHAANTLLLFAVFKKMTASLWRSAFVAAVFALHPMHVESVAWIAERKDVLSTFLWMLTLLAYVGYAKHAGLFRYLLTIILFSLGLMAKPMLVTLPFVLLLLDYWPLGRFAASKSWGLWLIIEKIPFFALSAVSSVVTYLVQQSSGAIGDVNGFTSGSRIANSFLSYARYMGKMFWPHELSVFYPYDAGSFALWQIIFFASLMIVISVFVIRLRHKQGYLPVGWFWFVGTLVPVIGLVQVGGQAMADRYTYIPYIGLFVMIAWGVPELISEWPRRNAVLSVFAMIFLISLGICSYSQISYWQNSAALFSHAIEVTKNNYVAHCNLAADLRSRGKLDLAIEHYKKALQISPDYPDALNGLGRTYGEQGNIAEAIKYFQKAILLKPASVSAYSNLGYALQRQGKLDEAAAFFRKAIQINPDYAKARYNLADLLILQGRFDEADEQLRVVIRLKPDWPDAMNSLALLIAAHPQIKGRDVNEAISLARRACQMTGYRNPVFLDTLAASYASAGRFSEAVDTAKKALNLADAAKQPQLKNDIQRHLAFYIQGKAYIEPSLDSNKP